MTDLTDKKDCDHIAAIRNAMTTVLFEVWEDDHLAFITGDGTAAVGALHEWRADEAKKPLRERKDVRLVRSTYVRIGQGKS